MKILVTGGAGFIGSQVAAAYVKDGHDVTVVDNLSTGFLKNVPGEAIFIKGDVNSTLMDKIFRDSAFDFVNHHAAQVNVRVSVEDPVKDAELNILSTVNLLKLSARHGIKHFIFVSSGGAIYGEQESFPAKETHKQEPVSPYGITKMAGEHYCRFFSCAHGLRTTCLRYANVYGPRQSPIGEAGVVAVFASCMLQGKTAVINGSGDQTRDYIYVGDVVEANRQVILKNVTGSYNIGTGKETSVNQIFDLIKKHTGSNQERVHREAKKGEQPRSVLDASLFMKTTGWEPAVKVENGIGLTVDFFRNENSSAYA